jgi:hypothetical protein
MHRIAKLPAAFKRFAKIGGVVGFAVFEGSEGSDEEAVEAIGSAIPKRATFNVDKLREIVGRVIRERKFFGDWFDPDTGALIKVGNWRTEKGEQLHNPKLKALEKVRIVGGGFSPPDPGSGGQFAYAFTTPPYSLRARPAEVQQLFDEVRDFIMPAGLSSEIMDWSSPRLREVSNCFVPGMEWWGVFLFTIHVPDLRRLTVAIASTTD